MRKVRTYGFILTLGYFIQSGACFAQTTLDDDRLQSGENLIEHWQKDNLKGFSWLNRPESYAFTDGIFTVLAPAESDYFNNPEDGKITGTAPFLYTEIAGDFVATTKVAPDFSSVWNAVALMVYWDSKHWIKFAFENSDATGPSIVSVVTREVSDDANGVILDDSGAIWLKLIRKGKLYAMHWSRDGENFKMARLAAMPEKEVIKIGIEAQCPAGSGAKHLISFFSLEARTVKDLRKGE